MAKSPTVPARPPCRLYLITPPVIPDLDAFANLLGQALDAGDVAALVETLCAQDHVSVDPSDAGLALLAMLVNQGSLAFEEEV